MNRSVNLGTLPNIVRTGNPLASIPHLRRHLLAALAASLLAGEATASGYSPFDDCVWWFDGGRLGTGESSRTVVSGAADFFDITHASTPDGAMHKLAMTGPAGGASIVETDVVSPLLGTIPAVPVLSVPQEKNPEDDKYYPNYFTLPASVKANFTKDSDVTVIARVRLTNSDLFGKTFYMMDLGYKIESGSGQYYGIPFGFVCDSGRDSIHLYYWSRLDNSTAESLSSTNTFKSNEWVDAAFVFKAGHTALGLLKAGSGEVSWTEKTNSVLNCGVGDDNIYISRGHTNPAQGAATRSYCFAGDIARIAIWNRALTKDEVFAAFAHGGADQSVVGLKNGTSSEFGGSTPIASAAEGFDWKAAMADNAAPSLAAGESFTYSFDQPVNKDKVNGVVVPTARQKTVLFALTDASAAGGIQIQANGRRVADLSVVPGREYTCVVRSQYLSASASTTTSNAIQLVRTDNNGGRIELDYVAFVSDWQIGYQDGSQSELKSGTGNYVFNMYAEPWTTWNPEHGFLRALRYDGSDTFRFHVPPSLAASHVSKYVVARHGENACDPESITGLYVDVNGVRKFATDISWGPTAETSATYELSFAAGELKGGYNTIKFGPIYDPTILQSNGTPRGWVYSDFHRFEWVYQKPQELGTIMTFR